MFADVKRLFEDALKQKVPLTRNGRHVTLAKVELGFEQLANQFAKGDRTRGVTFSRILNSWALTLPVRQRLSKRRWHPTTRKSSTPI